MVSNLNGVKDLFLFTDHVLMSLNFTETKSPSTKTIKFLKKLKISSSWYIHISQQILWSGFDIIFLVD